MCYCMGTPLRRAFRPDGGGCKTGVRARRAGLQIGGGYAPTGRHAGRSPDRADAMVWALTELLLKPRPEPGVRGL